MDPERLQRVRLIFERALELPEGQRSEFLGDACGDDARVRAEVERLLAAAVAAQAESGLTNEGPTRSAELAGAPIHGELIGPYRLRRLLGEGGMGVVYEAEQEHPVRRRVAIKLVKHGLVGTHVLARFEAERQALALMNHPNVARVLDAGTDTDGRPYFVMEFIQGIPITDYCDRHNLGTVERLKLLIDVCEGTQHAHQKGVIHRDLKPTNILVEIRDGKPVPRIIDFGVAKAIDRELTERSLFTEYGQVVGTPEYMSPEQAELTGLDVDTRTDVYSLGVLLYELLVGALPFDPRELRRAGLDEMRRRIREETPPKPSTRVSGLGDRSGEIARHRNVDPATLERLCRGDLDWITMKALEKDRTRRYASASELALDLRRHLQDEPVVAGPPSAVYRARKFIRRHRFGFALAASVSTAVIAGLVGTSWGLVRAVRAERQAHLEADTVREVSDFVMGVFEINDPSEARGRTVTAKEVLDRGAARIAAEIADRPALQARLMESMGLVYRSLGLYHEAQPLLEGAVVAQVRASGPNHPDAARAKTSLAGNLIKGGQVDEAISLLKAALAVQERALSPDDMELARTLNNLGTAYRVHKRYTDAIPLLERALAIREKKLGPNHVDVAKQLSSLGTVHALVKDFGSAQQELERALAIRERAYGPVHMRVAATLDDLALLYRKSGELDRARAASERALAIEDQQLPPGHPDRVNTIVNLAIIDRLQRDLAASESRLRQAIQLLVAAGIDPTQNDYQTATKELAVTLRALGREQEAAHFDPRTTSPPM